MKRKLLMVGRMRYTLPLSRRSRRSSTRSRRSSTCASSAARGGRGSIHASLVRPSAAGARRRGVLRAPAVPGRARAPRVPARRRARPGRRRRPRSRSSAALARVPTRVIADVHGDPAAPTRLYGSRAEGARPARRRARPLRAAAQRTACGRSPTTRPGVVRSVGVEPTATFAAFMDLEPFLATPPRRCPSARSRSSSACSSATRPSTSSPRRGACGAARARRDAPRRRPRDAARGRRAARRRPPEQTRWTESLRPGGRARARRGDRARAPLALGGTGPRRRRGVLPRPRRRREPGRRDPGPRRGRRDGLLVRPATPPPSPTRSCACSRPRARRAARRSGARSASSPGSRRPRSTRAGSASSSTRHRSSAGSGPAAGSPAYTHAMRADRAKQLLKNGVYRAIGETVSGAGGLDGDGAHAPRAHVPQGQRPLAEPDDRADRRSSPSRWRSSASSATPSSRSTTVRDHYLDGDAAPAGRRPDHVRRRLSRQPRERAADPAAARLSGRALRPDRVPRRRPAASARGGAAPARRAERDRRLGRARRARGRRHPHRVARHRAPAGLRARAGGGDCARSRSKLRLEERLGREVDAYAFVKGSHADYRPEHASLVQQAGYKLGVHVGLRGERARERPLPAPPLQRRAVPGADVRARPRGRLRPHRGQGHGARHARPAGAQHGARNRHR